MQLRSAKGTICGVFLSKNGVTEHNTLELHLLIPDESLVYLGAAGSNEGKAMGAVRKSFLQIVARGRNLVWILGCAAALVPPASGQTAAEAAGATSVAAGAAANAKPMVLPNPIPSQSSAGTPNGMSSQSPQTSPHIVGSPSGRTVEANRQSLETKAGMDGARLLLRSTPSAAQVWINNQPVGKTPLLLIVPPGKYTVEMRGTRQERGRQELALLPKETHEVALKLELHYPTRVVAAH